MNLEKLQILDNNILKLVETFHTDILNKVLRIITEIGEDKPVIVMAFIFAIIVGIIYIIKGKNAKTDEEEKIYTKFAILNSIFIVGTVGGIGVVNKIIKNVVKRPRPNVFPELLTDTGYSCPSSHAMVFSALMIVIMYYVANLKINSVLKILLEVLLVLFSVLMALTRVYFGVHYLTDITLGLILGYVLSLISIAIFNIIRKKIK